MKQTMFQMGFGSATPWMGQQQPRPRLAQAEMTKRMRDDVLNDISGALNTVIVLNDFIASQSDDPSLKKVLGADASRFWALSNSIAPIYQSVVDPLLERLSVPTPPWAQPTAQEAQDVRTWLVGVSEMSLIYRKHVPVETAAPEPESEMGLKEMLVVGTIAVAAGAAVLWFIPK